MKVNFLRAVDISPSKMDAHARYLCELHDLTVEWGGAGVSACAWRSQRKVKLAAIKGRVTYFTALHEIGHVVISPEPKLRLDQEVAAWRWALNASKWNPTPGVWKLIHRCLRNYAMRAIQRKSMKLPNRDSDFWKLFSDAAHNAGEAPERSTYIFWAILKGSALARERLAS